MSDRELLELAAKAAGYVLQETEDGYECNFDDSRIWNPITDDGDALRLMVRLRLYARQFPVLDDDFDAPLRMVEVWRVDDDDPMHVEFLRSGDDRLVATRRAIVRAAAEIGWQMP